MYVCASVYAYIIGINMRLDAPETVKRLTCLHIHIHTPHKYIHTVIHTHTYVHIWKHTYTHIYVQLEGKLKGTYIHAYIHT